MSELRWGILSTADIARTKAIPGIRRADRCRIVAIASRDLARAEAAAAEAGIPAAHGSYEALLADPHLDAVYIPLPNHLHATWTIEAARAGKHVLCEKPVALTSGDAQRMVDACREAGVHFMEAFMYRLHPSWLAVRDLVGSGRIGRLTAVQSWFSYFNDDPADIRNLRAAGGGALMDIGCYSINLSRMLFGGEPVRVEASLRRDPVSGVDIVTSALLEFAEGGIASFTCSIRTEPDQRVHIYGTEGRIAIGIPFNIPPDRPTHVSVTHGGEPPVAPHTETLSFATADPYGVEAQAFAEAVLDGRPEPTPPEDGVANMRVLEWIAAAAEGGGAVHEAEPR